MSRLLNDSIYHIGQSIRTVIKFNLITFISLFITLPSREITSHFAMKELNSS